MIQNVFLQFIVYYFSIANGTNQIVAMDMWTSINDYEHICDLGVEGGNIGVTIESVNDTIKVIIDPTTHLIEESVVVEGDMQWQVRYVILETNQKSWVPHHCNSFVLTFFKLNKGGVEFMDATKPQKMWCVICRHVANEGSSQSVIAWNARCQKGIMNYNAIHGIIKTKKHVLNEHPIDFERYKVQSKVSEAGGQ